MIRMHYLAPLALLAANPAWAQSVPPAPQSAPATPQSVPIPPLTPEDKVRHARLDEAVAAIHANKPAQAIAMFDPLLAEYEKAYAGEKRRIYCAHDYPQMLSYMLQAQTDNVDAVAIDPGWCMALWGRGFALIDLQQIDAAVPFLERAVALSPSHAHYLSELGFAYQSQKKWQLAYDTYRRAADGAKSEEAEQRKRSLRRAWFGMGYNLIELGRLDEAEKLFNQCLELYPDDQRVKGELQFIREQRAKKS